MTGIVASFALSAAASLVLTIVYVAGGQPQAEGLLLGIALGGLSVGLVLWAHRFMPGDHYVEERDRYIGHRGELSAAVSDFERGAQIERRGFIGKMLAFALGSLGVAALFPIRSLGSKPGRSLLHTSWSSGARVVTKDGLPVRLVDIDVGGFLTVFPEGHTDAADSQAVLVRLAEGVFEAPEGREDWAPEGIVVFSKICTHAGCPVGLYQPRDTELFCPCHQSAFNVSRAAEPVDGPATRPLPQLPVAADSAGFLVATGDFSDPVGPTFWRREDD